MSDVKFLSKTIYFADVAEQLSPTSIYASYVCIQPAATNSGRVWVTTQQRTTQGLGGFAIDVISSDVGGAWYNLNDEWARNCYDLSDIWIAAGVAGDKVNVLYFTDPKLNDRDILQEMQYHLLETANKGDSLTTSQWTMDNWLDELGAAHRIICASANLHLYHGQQTKRLNDDLVTYDDGLAINQYSQDNFFGGDLIGAQAIDFHRVAWMDSSSAPSYALQPSSSHPYDNIGATSAAIPQSYTLVEHGTRIMQLLPTPTSPGTLEAYYTGYGEDPGGRGTMFTVPDELTPYIKYGAMSMLLAYEGPGHDPIRAEYCRKRFDEGVQAAKLLSGDLYA